MQTTGDAPAFRTARTVERVIKALLALVPPIGVLGIFVFAIKAMLEGDRRERAAEAKWDREHAPAAESPDAAGGS